MNITDLQDKANDPNLNVQDRLDAALKLINNYFCPFDCDSCHSDDCPCDRLGCAGHDQDPR